MLAQCAGREHMLLRFMDVSLLLSFNRHVAVVRAPSPGDCSSLLPYSALLCSPALCCMERRVGWANLVERSFSIVSSVGRSK